MTAPNIQEIYIDSNGRLTLDGYKMLTGLVAAGPGGASWGGITGSLSAQTDLAAALGGKQPLATVLTDTTAAFTTAQESKLAGIDAGATANASDADLRDRATHTGSQTAATISDFSAAVAATAAVTANTAKVTNATHTGDVTGATALTIANDAVTFAKMQNASAASVLIGRGSAAGAGDLQEITLGTNLSMSGTTINAAAGASDISFVALTANYTLTSSTAVQKLFNATTNGAVTLATGLYRFDAILYLLTMSGTSGNARFDLKGAGTAVVANSLFGVTGIDNTTPTNVGGRGGSFTSGTSSVASMVTPTTGTGMAARISGLFRVTTGGTLIPSIQLVTAAAATVQAGSWFVCQRIGTSAATTGGTWT